LLAVITSHFYIWFSCKIFVVLTMECSNFTKHNFFLINMVVWISLYAYRQISRTLKLTTI
jgi:hypothetical protein